MPQGQGHQLAVNLYDETAYGVDPGTPSATKLYIDEFGVVAGQGYDEDNSVADRYPDAPLPGVIDVTGAIKPKLSAENIGTLLKHALGSVATAGTGPYAHTITIGDLPAGMVVEKDMGSKLSGAARYEKFNGDKVSGFSFEFGGNAQPSLSFDIQGAKSTLASSPLDATPTDNGNTRFSLFHASVEEGGSASAIVTAASLSFTNNLNGDGYAVNDNGIRSTLDEGKVGVSGEITARFENETLLNKAINNTESSLKFILSRGDGLGSVGNGYLEIECATLVFSRNSPAIEGPTGIMVKLGFVGYGANACKTVLKNQLAAI